MKNFTQVPTLSGYLPSPHEVSEVYFLANILDHLAFFFMLLLPLKRVLCLFSCTACGYLFLYRIAVVEVNEIRYLAIEIKMSMTSVTPPALWCDSGTRLLA